ncbi:hypothetical protein APY04_0044 [Hyphomicrobium sulfonivorans]|uniref:Uncharacterized protein n=1 Tax=Hyphomicrobium sulfonivorans TaxID=121290 RepID=A0A109BQ92_HYPSL|nr:hypothetical protein APY04_0044 [Hyphomicrobium sulfonivorans]
MGAGELWRSSASPDNLNAEFGVGTIKGTCFNAIVNEMQAKTK